jgi:predicted DNA-binding transcriptional regulator YafY
MMKASEVSFNEAIIRVAAVHGRRIQFRYAKGDGEIIETRTVEPKSVVVKNGDHMTFNGYDPDRDEIRSYRLDRIKGDVAMG